MPNVRKISMGPFVDVAVGAERIGRDFVFSRKPTPALLCVDDWTRGRWRRTCARRWESAPATGCPLEFILKDISTVRYAPQRLWEWEDIARDVVGAGVVVA